MIFFILCSLVYFVNAELIKYGNVSYQNSVIYEVTNPKNLHLKLISETGDADLYVFKSATFDKTVNNWTRILYIFDRTWISAITNSNRTALVSMRS